MKREIVVSLNDFHVPYQDDKAVKVAFDFVESIKPIKIIVHEILDWYSLSRFDKDPNRKLKLQDDLHKGISILEDIRNRCADSDIIMVESNHDRRLQKFLRNKAEELNGLDCLKLEELLHLKDFNIAYREDYLFRGILFKHGDLVRKYSSYTAKAELVDEGVSGASGHTHRLGMHFETNRGGKYVWMETGCLCLLKPEFIHGIANWQQGLGMYVFRENSKHFYPAVVPIIDHEIMWGEDFFKVA